MNEPAPQPKSKLATSVLFALIMVSVACYGWLRHDLIVKTIPAAAPNWVQKSDPPAPLVTNPIAEPIQMPLNSNDELHNQILLSAVREDRAFPIQHPIGSSQRDTGEIIQEQLNRAKQATDLLPRSDHGLESDLIRISP